MKSLINYFDTKPALKFVIPFMVGIIIGNFFFVNLFFLLAALLVLLILILFTMRYFSTSNAIFIILAIIIAGLFRYSISTKIFPGNHITRYLDSNERITIIGKVVGFPHQRQNRIEFEMAVDTLIFDSAVHQTNGKILVRVKDFKFDPVYGDKIQLYSKLREPPGERNPGEFNYKKYLAAQGVYGIVTVYRKQHLIKLSSPEHFSFRKTIFGVKAKIQQTINSLYDGKPRTLMQGLLLGERGEIPYELKESFAKCGVIHALAISGLHVGYLLIIFFAIFGLLQIPGRWKIIFVLLSLLFYNLIVGFKPPIVRASLMASLFLFGRLLQRPVDIINIIAAAAVIILFINPLELFQASFQLSFAAILSIVLIYQKLKNLFEKNRLIRKLMQKKFGEYTITLFLVSLAAQLGTLPIVVYYFHRLPVVSILVNLLVIPAVGIVIAYGFASVLFGVICFPVGELFANTSSLCLRFLIWLIETVGRLDFASFEMIAISFWLIAVYYFFLWIFLNLNKRRFQKLLIFSVLVLGNILLWRSVLLSQNWLYVTFFDVGQGDAALVTFPNGENMLIDAGPNLLGFDAGEAFLVPYFKRQGIDEIQTLVLSHADNDHIGGMPAVLRHVRAERIIDTGLYHDSQVCSIYQFLIDSLQLQHQLVNRASFLKMIDGVGVFVLHPGDAFLRQYQHDVNNSSVVLKIVYGERSFLFAGDIEQKAEIVLTYYGDILKSDVLKIPHHGSKTSSTLNLLTQVNPEYAVVSLGKHNRFNFPDSSVINRLKRLKINVLRTDQQGAIIFRTDGKKLERIH